MDGQVKIGREFFLKIKQDYSDWQFALAREFLQNSIDARGTSNVTVTIARSGSNTILTVANNGQAMNREILTDKLLTLGGSGKNFDGGNTGGVGVAKSLLYYCHLDYTIRTGKLLVKGSGAQYTIEEVDEFLYGTKSTITLEGDELVALVSAFQKFARYAQWNGHLTVNGEERSCVLHKGARRKELAFGVIYTNKAHNNICVVRLNGQPMFFRSTRFDGCVVVELNGKGSATLTSNRDGLRYPYANQLNELLTALAVDKKSALREQKAEYRRYQGERLRSEARRPKALGTLSGLIDLGTLTATIGVAGPGATVVNADGPEVGIIGTVTGPIVQGPVVSEGVETSIDGAAAIEMVIVSTSNAPKTISLGHEFIVKNATGKKTPARWNPESGTFGAASKKLIQVWAATLLKLHQVLELASEFSIGFILDDDCEAECETGPYGRVFYLNPAKLGSSAYKARHKIVSLAAHEIVHAMGLSEHDENYASKLTEVMAKVLENAKAWPKIFKTRRTKRPSLGVGSEALVTTSC